MFTNPKKKALQRIVQLGLILLFALSMFRFPEVQGQGAIPSLVYETTWATDYGIPSLAISGDGNYVVARDHMNGNVTLFYRPDNTVLWSYINAVNYTQYVAISDNGSYICAVGWGGYCALFHKSSSTPQRIWYLPDADLIRDVVMSRDGAYIAVISYETVDYRGTLFFLNRNNASIQWKYTFGYDFTQFSDVDISGNGGLIIAGSPLGLYVFGKDSNTPIWIHTGTYCPNVAISPDASTIFAFGGDGFHYFQNSSSTPVWSNATTGVSTVRELAISANGSRMVAACYPNSVLVFYNTSAQPVRNTTLSGEPRNIDLTDDGDKFCVAVLNQTASLFSISNPLPLWSKVSTQNVTVCRMSNDANYLVMGNHNGLSPGFIYIIEFKDSDQDGISDQYETITTGTNPNSPDSDSDGLGDLEEVTSGSDGYITNPNLLDTDADGLNDSEEATLGVDNYLTNPTLPDSDSDGLIDFWEWKNASDPGDTDSDNDLLSDGDEANTYHTNVTSTDTDNDGISDYDEVYTYPTNPIVADSDTDGLTDGEEVFTYFTDPVDSDSDNDQLLDGWEVLHNTDPKNQTGDIDNDGLTDAEEVLTYYTVYSDPDTDDDQLFDGLEVHNYHTDPKKWDSDGDTYSDGEEIQKGTDPNDPNSHPTSGNQGDIPDGLGGVLFVGVIMLGIVLVVVVVVIVRKKSTKKII